MGRPKKYDPEQMAEIIEKYTEKEKIPVLKEVCYLNKWNHKYIYELAEENDSLSESIKMLLYKKEFMLEKSGLSGDINSTVAIFSLKQLGWKDRKELEHTTLDNKGKKAGFVFVDAKRDPE